MIGALMLAPDEICFPICSTEFTTKVHVMIALLTAVVAILIGWLIVKYTKRTNCTTQYDTANTLQFMRE